MRNFPPAEMFLGEGEYRYSACGYLLSPALLLSLWPLHSFHSWGVEGGWSIGVRFPAFPQMGESATPLHLCILEQERSRVVGQWLLPVPQTWKSADRLFKIYYFSQSVYLLIPTMNDLTKSQCCTHLAFGFGLDLTHCARVLIVLKFLFLFFPRLGQWISP